MHTARLRVRVYGLLFVELLLMVDTVEKDLTRDVSEKRCYIGRDYDAELNSTAETDNFTTCELPDGTSSPSAQILPLPQVLFQIFLVKEPVETRFDIDIRNHLHANVEFHKDLMFQRIVERMTKELTDTFHDDHLSRRRRGTLVRCKERKKEEEI